MSETEDNISHVSSQPDQSLNHCLLWLLTLEINLEVKHLLSVEEIVIGCEYNRLTICQETFSDNKQTEERGSACEECETVFSVAGVTLVCAACHTSS